MTKTTDNAAPKFFPKTFLVLAASCTLWLACGSKEKARERADDNDPSVLNAEGGDKSLGSLDDKKIELPQGSASSSPNSPPAASATPAPANPNPPANSKMAQLQDRLRAGQKINNLNEVQNAALQILSENSNDVMALNALGVVYFQREKFRGSLYFLNRAAKVNPNASEVYTNIGLARMALGHTREAIAALKKAIELSSDNATASANIGSLLVAEKSFDKASVALQIAQGHYSSDYGLAVNYGVALAGIGKYEDAKGQFEKALRIKSSGREAIFDLAYLNIHFLKKYNDGLDLITKLRFFGGLEGSRQQLINLETEARAGIK